MRIKNMRIRNPLRERWSELIVVPLTIGVLCFCVIFFTNFLDIPLVEKIVLQLFLGLSWTFVFAFVIDAIYTKNWRRWFVRIKNMRVADSFRERWWELVVGALGTGVICFCVIFFTEFLDISSVEKFVLRLFLGLPWAFVFAFILNAIYKKKWQRLKEKYDGVDDNNSEVKKDVYD